MDNAELIAGDKVAQAKLRVSEEAVDLDRAYIDQFLEELRRMVQEDGDVRGMFVLVQRGSRVYPHLVGGCDAARMLGIAQAYLTREIDKQLGFWTSNAMDRRMLEGGL